MQTRTWRRGRDIVGEGPKGGVKLTGLGAFGMLDNHLKPGTGGDGLKRVNGLSVAKIAPTLGWR